MINSRGCCLPESDSSQHLSPGVLDFRMKVLGLLGIHNISNAYSSGVRKKSKGLDIHDYTHGLIAPAESMER